MILYIILTSLSLIVLTIVYALYVFRNEKSGDAAILISFFVGPMVIIEPLLVTVVFLAINAISKRIRKK